MEAAKIFSNGGSQAVRLPKDDPWRSMLDSLELFTDDFLAEGMDDLPVQERAEL